MANTLVYFPQGGQTLQVGDGGIINVQSGGEIIIEDGATLSVATGGSFEPASGTLVLPNGSIETAALATKAVTFSKADAFLSAIETGTGSPQSIAHGLGVVPTAVIITPVSTTPSSQVWAVVYGTNTTTDIVVTVTADATFLAFAWA